MFDLPSVERRLVSVLFADLTGFTAFSESHDAEDVRQLVATYFAAARRITAAYGGTIRKYEGDGVMAVWGAPVALEDDAERAVRAALDLVAAVTNLGDRLGLDLRLRVGVLTGEAAVDLAGVDEGMVQGDAVNTASRLQSIAEPGTVLVDDVTRLATERAIVYQDAGHPPDQGQIDSRSGLAAHADRRHGRRCGATAARTAARGTDRRAGRLARRA